MTEALSSAAFYTPLKHPFQIEVSGDRETARALMAGLRACGFEAELASRMLTWRREFEPALAERMDRAAALIVATLVRRYRRRPPAWRPRFWMTYQNYYRCPDLLGPVVSSALGIPYILVDAAVSTKSRRTAFRPWASAARLALRRADLVFAMHPRDIPRIARLRGSWFEEHRLLLLPPAVDTARFDVLSERRAACRSELARRFPASDGPVLLCVAMLREADKLDSYRLLASALAHLCGKEPALPWRLAIVGDGPARPKVEASLALLPPDRVCLLGTMDPGALPPLYLGADIFAFPGLGEALGLVYLEAAAAGLPVLACRGPGPEFMVAPGGGILTERSPEAFARGLRSLLLDPSKRHLMGEAARRFAATERTPEAQLRVLRDGLARLGLA